jgi:hypothetical protein
MVFPFRKDNTVATENRPLPPIDLLVPEHLRTATFALG